MGIASAILFTPLLTALLILLSPARVPRVAQWLALAGAGATLGLTLMLLQGFDAAVQGAQFSETLPWVPEIGVHYSVGVDGVSLPMVLLTALLALVAVVASIGMVDSKVKGYFAWFLVLEFAILGVFLAQDWFLFYVFWEIALIPMFFLIGVWGDERRGVASMSFFLYTLAGSVLLLLGMVAAYLANPEHSFDMASFLKASAGWDREFQIFVFACFFVGVAVKIPSVPLHGWLPLAHVQAPVPVSMMLSGVMLKMGAYGLLRMFELVPLGAEAALEAVLGLGLLSIVYGAFMAWRQDDLKAMVAYSSISHMGFVMVGVAAHNISGMTGALNQMFTHGVITAALFMLVGVVYQRTHTRQLSDLGGLARPAPRYAVVMTVALLASMGLPGLAGFISEFHVLVGAFERWGVWVALAGVGVLVTSAYSLRVFARMFVSPPTSHTPQMTDLNLRELAVVTPLVLLMLVLGLFPGAFLSLSNPALDALLPR
ncbi:MAG: NADH-quinone oxidoreductase subunit M [Rubrivivax sp.]|nr:NADH-quinone oxidoreductase subunit M [Rubrivivax sp.]